MNYWMIHHGLCSPEQGGPRILEPPGTTSLRSLGCRPSPRGGRASSPGPLAFARLPQFHLSCPLFPLVLPGSIRNDKCIAHNSLSNLLKEAGTNPQGRLLLHQPQQLLLGQGALLQVHIGCKEHFPTFLRKIVSVPNFSFFFVPQPEPLLCLSVLTQQPPPQTADRNSAADKCDAIQTKSPASFAWNIANCGTRFQFMTSSYLLCCHGQWPATRVMIFLRQAGSSFPKNFG